MSVTNYVIKTSLLFVVLIIVLKVISTLIGFKTNPNIDIVVLLILLRQYGIQFGLANNAMIKGKLFWTLYASFVGVYLTYKILLFVAASALIPLSMHQILVQLSIDATMSLLFTPLSLALTNRAITKATNEKPQPLKVYSVTDAVSAEDIIKHLKNNNIEAFSDSVHLHGDPLLGAISQNGVDILLRNPEDHQLALENIETYFKQIENQEPWECPSCGEENEGSFEVCWKCQAGR